MKELSSLFFGFLLFSAVSIRSSMASEGNSTNNATALTADEIKIVESTWSTVMKDPVNNGMAILTAFFKKYQDYQKEFQAFKDIPLDELSKNEKFQSHCLNVINALNSAITSLKNPETLEPALLGIGQRHQKRGQTKEQFQHLKDVILEVLKEKLGNDFKPETSTAWTKTIDAALSGIFKAFP